MSVHQGSPAKMVNAAEPPAPATPECSAEETLYNKRAVHDLADIVICGQDSDEDTKNWYVTQLTKDGIANPTCDHQAPNQWVCSGCRTPNWEARKACRNCWLQRNQQEEWIYPNRAAKPDTKSPATANSSTMCRPCTDCGLVTGCFCDKCCAQARRPPHWSTHRWQPLTTSPLCTHCDKKWAACHHCRRVSACSPFPHGHGNFATRPDGMPNEIYVAAGPMSR